MSSPLPSLTLADRLAGLSSDASLEAAEAWRLKRLWLEMLARMFTMLAGLAAQFAAGTLPAPTPQAVRPTPMRQGFRAANAPHPGRVDRVKIRFLTEVSATETLAPNRAAPATMRPSGLDRRGRGVGQPHLGPRPDRRPPRRNEGLTQAPWHGYFVTLAKRVSIFGLRCKVTRSCLQNQAALSTTLRSGSPRPKARQLSRTIS